MSRSRFRQRVVVAGQIPPPFGGQAIMIRQLLDELADRPEVEIIHLPFYFTKSTQSARKAGFGKIAALFGVFRKLLKIRLRGPIDLLIFPAGGPQLVPVVRDLFLLPAMRLASRRLIIHFHAGGIADHLERLPLPLRTALKFLSRRADAALVMTDFGRRDPLSLGIERILCVPHALEDTFLPEKILARHLRHTPPRLLYVGHLCRDKGTFALLEAVAALKKKGFPCRLILVGECLAPCTAPELKEHIRALNLEDSVELPGVLRGDAKWEQFARAELFVFPSVAPYESFGLAMVEAMMWSLPVIATDWRGNQEILTAQNALAPELCFALEPDLAQPLEKALASALQRQKDWPIFGNANRQAFDQRFNAAHFPNRLSNELVKFTLKN